MSVTRSHGPYLVVHDSTQIGGITQLRADFATQERSEAADGEVYARHQSLFAQNPTATFTTLNIAEALALCGITGSDIDGLTNGLILHQQLYADGATRGGASAHRKMTISDGILVPRRLTCDFQGDASLSYEAIISYDGSNNPLILAESQSLPAYSSTAERFTIGPVTIGSLTFDHIRSLEVDFGIDVVAEGADSDIWPTKVYIRSIKPTLTIRGLDVEWWDSTKFADVDDVIHAIKIGTHANTTIYLRKRETDGSGTFVADGTEEHVSITAAGMGYVQTPFDNAGPNAASEVTAVLTAMYDGSNTPLVIDTTAAIS